MVRPRLVVRLRLLGTALLYRDERPITGRAGQRHPLALLALLATSPGEAASRDKLIGILWPESDTQRARHRLSQALYVLRRHLGADCLQTPSGGVVLNPEVVWTDVGAFGKAVLEGRLNEAVRLYAGPFLDGFFLNCSQVFEEWVESERRRLAGLYHGALRRLATEAGERGDHLAATTWWGLLADHEPSSVPIALACMHAQMLAGDRVGALRRARAHLALIQGEYGMPPDPAVLELARELAEGPESSDGELP